MPRLPHRPPRRIAVATLLVLVAATLAAGAIPAAGAPHHAAPKFSHLDPGGPARYAERVPVNLVFVGFEPGKHVQQGTFLAGLPERYRPLVRSRLLHGIKDFLGIDYRYRYNVRFTDTAYENRFFATLGKLATPADDNYVDGTQSFVFAFIDASIAELGYGLATTLIHEVGHHVAMSHPHDGYDYEDDVDYEGTGPFNFASSGDESNSMMSYIDLNWDFSQFDRDNMNRYLAAAYTSNANRIAAAVLADPDAARALARLRAADRLLGAAKSSFSGHRYLPAAALAVAAYREVVAAARIVGVPVASAKAGSTVAKPAAAARTGAGHLNESVVDTLHPDSRRARR